MVNLSPFASNFLLLFVYRDSSLPRCKTNETLTKRPSSLPTIRIFLFMERIDTTQPRNQAHPMIKTAKKALLAQLVTTNPSLLTYLTIIIMSR